MGAGHVHPTPRRRHGLSGVIASAGFASGDRVVVGHWSTSPIGPLTDVMWATPDGRRLLLVPTEAAADFVSGVYGFDEVRVVAFQVTSSSASLHVRAGDRRVSLAAGIGVPIPFRRPAALTRWVEGPIARATMGVRTYGTSPTGVREWYRADRWQPVVSGRAEVAGVDLGELGPVDPPAGFGFSEPPRRPSWVRVRPLLEYPRPVVLHRA